MSKPDIKRFYTDVNIQQENGQHCILLDGRAARTAGRHPLGSSSLALAKALAEEWERQEGAVDLRTMPLTRLQGFVLDGGEAGIGEWTDVVHQFAGSDLLCYRAPYGELAARQLRQWQPVLDRLSARFGGAFVVTEGITPVAQSPEVLAAIKAWLLTLTPAEAFIAKQITEIFGSAALSMATLMGEIDPDTAYKVSRLDEDYQIEKWGTDDEATGREASIKAQFDVLVRFLELSRDQKA